MNVKRCGGMKRSDGSDRFFPCALFVVAGPVMSQVPGPTC